MLQKMAAFCIALWIPLSFTACTAPKELRRYEAQFFGLFDTITTIVAYTDDKELFSSQAQRIRDELEEYNRLYDIYNEYEGIANLKTINDAAGKKPVQVDRRILDLLLFAKEIYVQTDGTVNIAFGSVLAIWHDYRERGIDNPKNAKLPPLKLLQEAAEHTDISKVYIDEAASTVFLADPKMRLDVGAVAKGYAAEQVCQTAIQSGFTSGLVSVGGNIRAIGRKAADQSPWNTGIQKPGADAQELLDIVNLGSGESLVTSGDYQRYYTVNGQRYHHIIDPQTLMPAQNYSAVTVICQDSGRADALSTALYNMNIEQGQALIQSFPNTEAVWVYKDGRREYSGGFSAYLKP